jgi:hypothetical protein
MWKREDAAESETHARCVGRRWWWCVGVVEVAGVDSRDQLKLKRRRLAFPSRISTQTGRRRTARLGDRYLPKESGNISCLPLFLPTINCTYD